MRLLAIPAFAIAALSLLAADSPDSKVLFEQNFASPDSVKDFHFTHPTEWKYGKDADGGFLELAYDRKAKPGYPTKHRSPFHFALIADKVFGDFTYDVELQSTVAPYGHQDMCLFFGFEGPEKYYYVHMAVAADPHAHNIFIVNNADRKAIATETTKGIVWKEKTWHKARIVREASSGKIEVYFDDMTKPIMRAVDKTFTTGYIGFGSFDDTGKFRNIKVTGPSVETKKLAFLKPLEK